VQELMEKMCVFVIQQRCNNEGIFGRDLITLQQQQKGTGPSSSHHHCSTPTHNTYPGIFISQEQTNNSTHRACIIIIIKKECLFFRLFVCLFVDAGRDDVDQAKIVKECVDSESEQPRISSSSFRRRDLSLVSSRLS
jgi:hypothetical protein